MGMYDTVIVKCPKCGTEREFQSKSGNCFLEVYTLENCPDDVMANVNRHSPCKCECGVEFEVDIENRKAVVSGDNMIYSMSYGFQIGKHIFEIEADSEKDAMLILVKDYWEWIDKNGKVELLGGNDR